ncbi:hypothetical protein C3L33_05767, partial [Rhododendron williamsianum]
MDFQVVVLAGGTSKELIPLVSNVVEGEDAALRVGGWISSAYVDRLHVEVAAVPEDVGTAGALRAIGHHLTAHDILVVSGDLVCDVPPGAVAAAHRRHDAVVTAMLCSAPVSGPSDSASSGGKDKAKKPGRYNIIGLDPTRQFMLFIAAGAEVEKDVRVQKSILRAVGQMEIRADLMDAHLYAFKRSVLQEILDQKENFHSLRQDVLPFLVRSQLRSELSLDGAQAEENGNDKAASLDNKVMLSQLMANASSQSFHEHGAMGPNGFVPFPRKTHKCCVYIASKSKYCARLNSIQAFSDINRDVIGEASHLSGYSFSAHNNIIHPSAVLGSKTTVSNTLLIPSWKTNDFVGLIGFALLSNEGGATMHARRRFTNGRQVQCETICSWTSLPIGSNVKVVNSVIMDHVTIGDGCSIQGSVICSNVQLQDRVVLKDCQVGAGFVVSAGSEYKGESLAKK